HIQRNVAQHGILAETLGHILNPEQRRLGRSVRRPRSSFRSGHQSQRSHRLLTKPKSDGSLDLLRETSPKGSFTALPLLRSISRYTWRAAAHSARNKAASGSCPHRQGANSSLLRAS